MNSKLPNTTSRARQQRRLEAIRLHEIEGNPFTPEDNELFELFDREGWSDAERREYLISEARRRAETTFAAE